MGDTKGQKDDGFEDMDGRRSLKTLNLEAIPTKLLQKEMRCERFEGIIVMYPMMDAGNMHMHYQTRTSKKTSLPTPDSWSISIQSSSAKRSSTDQRSSNWFSPSLISGKTWKNKEDGSISNEKDKFLHPYKPKAQNM